MWSIIKRVDDETHDIVPNSWLKSGEVCLYPNVNFKQTKAMARRCSPPEANWEEMVISIVKRDYDDYDRGYMDMFRFSTGKRSVSASENEEKGRGKRKKIMSHKHSSVSSSSSSDENPSSKHQSPKKKYIPKGIPPFPKLQMPSDLSPGTIHQAGASLPSEIRPSTIKTSCPLTGKKHSCSIEKGQVTLESLAKAVCQISRYAVIFDSRLNYLKNHLMDEGQKELKVSKMCSNNKDDSQETESYNIEGILSFFPIANLNTLQEAEKKLGEDKQYFESCIQFFSSAAEKSNDGRTVASIMNRMMTLSIAQQFTFKGIQRKDHKEKKEAFKDLHLCRVVLSATRRCWPSSDVKRIQLLVGIWLAQAKHKLGRVQESEKTDPKNN